MSNTTTLFPIIGALREAYFFKNQSRGPWSARTDVQERFLKEFYGIGCEQLDGFSQEEMKYIASFNHTDINSWLKTNGFNIQLDPFQNPTDFGAASMMDVAVKWIEAGTQTQVCGPSKVSYDAVSLTLKSRSNPIIFNFDNKVYPNPIARIVTKNSDVVHMTIADEACEGMDLIAKVSKLEEVKKQSHEDKVIFPMIDIDDQPNISWLERMFFDGVSAIDGIPGQMEIKQALQQTRFKMNHEGARVKSAAAVGMMRCLSIEEPPMVIDKPFYLWITRKNISIPYFAAYFDVDSWKNPGSLAMPGDK